MGPDQTRRAHDQRRRRLSDREQRRRLSDRIVATSALLYWVIDADSRIAFANEASGHLLGYDPDELIGRPATEFVHTDDLDNGSGRARPDRRERHARADRATCPPMAMRVRCSDGSLSYFDVGAVVALDDPDVNGIIIRGRPMNGQQLLDQALESLVASSPLADVLMYLQAGLAADLPGSRVAIAHDWHGDHFAAAVASGVNGDLLGVEPMATPTPACGVVGVAIGSTPRRSP